MAHSVEIRFPFLDPEVVQVCSEVPPGLKHRRFNEKHVLKQAASGWVTESIRRRRKMPLTTPWGTPLVGDSAPDSLRELLEPATVKKKGYFDPDQVAGHVSTLRKAESEPPRGYLRSSWKGRFQKLVLSGMAVNMVTTTHLWDETFRGQAS